MGAKIIWWLFQSETAPPVFDGYENYAFGIGGGTDHIHMDLSTLDCIKELEKYPKPDVIFASPPCETWVNVSVGNIKKFSTKKGINQYYECRNFTPFDFKVEYKNRRLNGENTAMTTAKVIQHFKPKYWFIENGNSSLIFRFLNIRYGLNGFLNKYCYAAYGFDVWKPTIIYSNKSLFLYSKRPNRKLNLITTGNRKNKITYESCKAKGIEVFRKNDYARKSKVPPKLYQSILSQIKSTRFPLEETV